MKYRRQNNVKDGISEEVHQGIHQKQQRKG